MKKSLIVLAVFVSVLGALIWYSSYSMFAPDASKKKLPVIETVTYLCDANKNIKAEYTDEYVSIYLSDGRNLELPQVRSGSGLRYEMVEGESDIVFASKGDNAFLDENSVTIYDNCVAGIKSTSPNGINTYTDQNGVFSFSYPNSFILSGGGAGYTENWTMLGNPQMLGLLLTKAIVDDTFDPSTNFRDATFSVGTSVDAKAISSCLKSNNGSVAEKSPVNINGMNFTKITLNGAGAGNFYETVSYRHLHNDQCFAIEYTIHSTNLGNYSPEQGITKFNEEKIKSTLEQIVKSFKFLQ